MCVCVCVCVIHIHINVPPTTLIVKDETSYMSVVLCWCTISPRGYHLPSGQCFDNDMVIFIEN